MSYECIMLKDSISPAGHRFSTFQCTFPRFILAEVNTHRLLSRSSASSRAIPVEKQIKRVLENPFVPIYWGKNQKGMQAEEELTEEEQIKARAEWLNGRDRAVIAAERLLAVGVHKQLTNRLLEPFMWHTAIISGTEWANFFALRRHKDAQPEFKRIADMIYQVMEASRPVELTSSQWHLPLFEAKDLELLQNFAPVELQDIPKLARKISVGRVARTSYLTHDGKRDLSEDISLHDRILKSGHMSPFEAVARPMSEHELFLFSRPGYDWNEEQEGWKANGKSTYFLGNVQGWVQYRKLIKNEHDFSQIQTG